MLSYSFKERSRENKLLGEKIRNIRNQQISRKSKILSNIEKKNGNYEIILQNMSIKYSFTNKKSKDIFSLISSDLFINLFHRCITSVIVNIMKLLLKYQILSKAEFK